MSPSASHFTIRTLFCAACLGLMALSALGQPRSDDPLRFFVWVPQDVGAFAGGFVGTRTLYAAGAGATLLALSRFDGPLTERAATIADGTALRVIEEFGNEKAVRPMALMIFVGALMSGEPRFQDAAFTSLETVVVANLVTNTLKSVFGRARPWQQKGPSEFKPFSDNTSFPSGHATTVFAFITPWFFYYPGVATGSLIVLAGATAFSRMATNVHWLTDVMAGSAIGFTTGYWLSRRHQRRAGRVRVNPTVGFNRIGVTVGF